tara:strand:- start:244 stop:594 length:351 start_codon:yes stop_codon:yes gene_type:complete
MYESDFPNYTLKFTKFQLLEYKTIKKNLSYISNTLINSKQNGTLHIDLFTLEEYDNTLLTKLVAYLYNHTYYNITNVYIYINKQNSSYLTTASFYIAQQVSTIPIELIELENEKKW